MRIWRRKVSGGKRTEVEQEGEEQGTGVLREEESEELSGETASVTAVVGGREDPFSASEDEIRAIEDWWSQKEEVSEEEEEESEEGEGGAVSGKEGDESTDLISRLKEIGSEEEEEEAALMREMEKLGNLSVEDLLLLAKEIREGVEKIKEERKERLEAVEKSASARAREEAGEGAKAKKARDEKSSHRVFS